MYTYFKTLWTDPAAARKAVLAIAAVAVQIVTIAFIDWTYTPIVIALATALGVYAVPNVRGKRNGRNNPQR